MLAPRAPAVQLVPVMKGRRLDPGAHGGPALPVPYNEFRPRPEFGPPTNNAVFSLSPGLNTVVDGPDSAVVIPPISHAPSAARRNAFCPFSSGRGTNVFATKMWGRLICVLPRSRLGLEPRVRVW